MMWQCHGVKVAVIYSHGVVVVTRDDFDDDEAVDDTAADDEAVVKVPLLVGQNPRQEVWKVSFLETTNSHQNKSVDEETNKSVPLEEEMKLR